MRFIVIAILLLPFQLLIAGDPQIPENIFKNNDQVTGVEYYSDGIFIYMILFDYDIHDNLIKKTYIKGYIDTPGVWINLFLHEYQYDANNNMTSDIRQDFRDGAWTNTGREYNEWDDKGNLLASGNMYFTDENKWIFAYKYDYKYDEYGNQIYLLYSRNLDNSDTLTPMELYTWEYPDGVKVSRMISYFYNNGYHVSRIRLYDYDENGRFIQYRNFLGLTDTVVDYAQVKYNALGQVVLRTEGYLDGSDNIKNTYAIEWDDAGNQTSKLGTSFLNGEIKSNSQKKWTYDLKKNITSQSFESWMHDSANVITGERVFITYDDSSNYLTKSYEAILNDKWTPIERFTYTYDKQNQETSSIFENYYDGNWENKYKTLREFDDIRGNLWNIFSYIWYSEQWLEFNSIHQFQLSKQNYYLEAYKIIILWDMTEIRETKPKEANISIIPNPSAENIRIISSNAVSQIMITDLTGMSVLKKNIYMPEELIDISNLPVGFYMITVQTNENSFSRKFCKMK